MEQKIDEESILIPALILYESAQMLDQTDSHKI